MRISFLERVLVRCAIAIGFALIPADLSFASENDSTRIVDLRHAGILGLESRLISLQSTTAEFQSRDTPPTNEEYARLVRDAEALQMEAEIIQGVLYTGRAILPPGWSLIFWARPDNSFAGDTGWRFLPPPAPEEQSGQLERTVSLGRVAWILGDTMLIVADTPAVHADVSSETYHVIKITNPSSNHAPMEWTLDTSLLLFGNEAARRSDLGGTHPGQDRLRLAYAFYHPGDQDNEMRGARSVVSDAPPLLLARSREPIEVGGIRPPSIHDVWGGVSQATRETFEDIGNLAGRAADGARAVRDRACLLSDRMGPMFVPAGAVVGAAAGGYSSMGLGTAAGAAGGARLGMGVAGAVSGLCSLRAGLIKWQSAASGPERIEAAVRIATSILGTAGPQGGTVGRWVFTSENVAWVWDRLVELGVPQSMISEIVADLRTYEDSRHRAQESHRSEPLSTRESAFTDAEPATLPLRIDLDGDGQLDQVSENGGGLTITLGSGQSTTIAKTEFPYGRFQSEDGGTIDGQLYARSSSGTQVRRSFLFTVVSTSSGGNRGDAWDVFALVYDRDRNRIAVHRPSVANGSIPDVFPARMESHPDERFKNVSSIEVRSLDGQPCVLLFSYLVSAMPSSQASFAEVTLPLILGEPVDYAPDLLILRAGRQNDLVERGLAYGGTIAALQFYRGEADRLATSSAGAWTSAMEEVGSDQQWFSTRSTEAIVDHFAGAINQTAALRYLEACLAEGLLHDNYHENREQRDSVRAVRVEMRRLFAAGRVTDVGTAPVEPPPQRYGYDPTRPLVGQTGDLPPTAMRRLVAQIPRLATYGIDLQTMRPFELSVSVTSRQPYLVLDNGLGWEAIRRLEAPRGQRPGAPE